MTQKPLEQQTQVKKSYSYQDLLKMSSSNIYSSMGNPILSNKPSGPRVTFGKSERSSQKKKFDGKQFVKQFFGQQGPGPAGYLPPRHVLNDGKIVQSKDPLSELKYSSTPSYSIGKSPKKNQKQIYPYMNNENDQININEADLKRKKSSSNILFGTERRFSRERLDKITPGPTYDPSQKLQHVSAPKYTMGSRRPIKGQDPNIQMTSTTNLVGPSTYFQKVKSISTSSLSRIPYDSKIKKDPVISFTKAPKTLTQLRNSVDQTYDLKTQQVDYKRKTISSHYDFQYDGGKGYQSGRSYMKKNLISSSQNPIQKNKMGSFTINKADKQKQKQKRGFFKNTMEQAPKSVKISIPKF